MVQKIVRRLLMTGFVAFFSSLSLMAQHKLLAEIQRMYMR